ncbi:MAG: hypothetical protein MJ033_07850 [Victivallaceae bacterium]|nr:hypothetical protein [Victivallaceae bacterium]
MNRYFDLSALKKLLSGKLLLLDRAQTADGKTFTAIKNISVNESFFCGHFPGHPIMPGVLQLEAMKQLAEVACRETLDPENKLDVYLKSASRVKFRRPVNPGDRIKVEAEILSVADQKAEFKTKLFTASGLASEAQLLLAARPKEFIRTIPDFPNDSDLSDQTVLDTNAIMKILPHRYPFLLIDYAQELTDESIRVVKNLTQDEPFFADADPAYPVLPESILCEIAAQSGCVSVLSRPENAGKIAVFMAIEKAESFFPVGAGDQLLIRSTLPPSKAKFGRGTGEILCDGKLAFQIQMMFAVVDA